MADIEVADSRAKLGYPDEARRSYSAIANRATQLGAPRVAAFARIRLALLDVPSDPSVREAVHKRHAIYMG